jgi:preprotein translocase subunit YajC
VKTLLLFVIFAIVVVALLTLSARARRRQAATAADRSERLTIGSEVMTTSGLYGTVVGRNDDDTVMLSIAPGIEVKWAMAALRDLDSLPAQYRRTAPPVPPAPPRLEEAEPIAEAEPELPPATPGEDGESGPPR